MSLNAADADDVYRSAYALLGHHGEGIGVAGLQTRLARRWSQLPGSTPTDFRTVASRVFDAARTGRVLQDEPDFVARPQELPKDFSLLNEPGRYGYRVRVEAVLADGSRTSTLVFISDDQLLSGAEVTAAAEQVVLSQSFAFNTSPRRGPLNGTVQIQTVILSAGQRP